MFKQSHWKKPRATIASHYEHNDYGYVFHGASILIDVLNFANLTIQECKSKTILDYGCGTGRVARLFALTGAAVYGYDPVQECISEADREGKLVADITKVPKILTTKLVDIPKSVDLVYCINVLEHLRDQQFSDAISNIESWVAEAGQCVVLLHKTKNKQFFEQRSIAIHETSKSIIALVGVKVDGEVIYHQVFR